MRRIGASGALLLWVGLWWACGTEPPAPAAKVPSAWRDVRKSVNHEKHLAKGDIKCGDCHLVDDYKVVELAACARCHEKQHSEDIHTRVPMTKTSTVLVRDARCYDCHAFREEQFQSWDCWRCHQKAQGEHGPVAVHIEETCKACHHPHSPEVLAPGECKSCHEKIGVAHGALKDPAQCRQCHGGHQPKAASRDGCLECHKKTVPIVTARTVIRKHKGCLECHAPHQPEAPVLACDGCHDKVKVVHNKKAHGQERCIECHAVHTPLPTGRMGPKPCLDCHDKLAPQGFLHSKKVTCAECHQKHNFPATLDLPLCVRCHEVKTEQGHAKCFDCHKTPAHAPEVKPPPCKDCHAEVHASAVKGHQQCLDCHLVHGQTKAEAACDHCHEQKKALHGAIEGGCRRCHRPHAPFKPEKPPVCTSCHELKQLPGLHATAKHQECAKCHTTHKSPRADRETCLACHPAQRAHYPEAKLCKGCHPFSTAGLSSPMPDAGVR